MHGSSVYCKAGVVCEKYQANGKDVFWAFMESKKAYDMINRRGLWQMLRVFGVGGRLSG